jgi:hypothetical protein
MNYDLAIMALDGLSRGPLALRVRADGAVLIEGERAAFKELARLCLLLGGGQAGDDGFELQPGVHVTDGSPALLLAVAGNQES